jgi:hypothetical protein
MDDEVAAVREWLDGVRHRVVECESKAGGEALEDDFKDEYKPPLTKG